MRYLRYIVCARRRRGPLDRALARAPAAPASPPASSQILHSPQDIEFYIYTNNYIILT